MIINMNMCYHIGWSYQQLYWVHENLIYGVVEISSLMNLTWSMLVIRSLSFPPQWQQVTKSCYVSLVATIVIQIIDCVLILLMIPHHHSVVHSISLYLTCWYIKARKNFFPLLASSIILVGSMTMHNVVWWWWFLKGKRLGKGELGGVWLCCLFGVGLVFGVDNVGSIGGEIQCL